MGSDEERLEEMLKSMMEDSHNLENSEQGTRSGLDALKLAKEKEVNMEEEPIALEEEPIALEEEPIALEEEPIALEEEPIALEEEPIALEEEPMTLESLDNNEEGFNLADFFSDNEALADIQDLLEKSDNHEPVSHDISGGDILAEMNHLVDVPESELEVDLEKSAEEDTKAKKKALKEQKRKEKKEKKAARRKKRKEEQSFEQDASTQDSVQSENAFEVDKVFREMDAMLEEGITNPEIWGAEEQVESKPAKPRKEKKGQGNSGSFWKKWGEALFGVDEEIETSEENANDNSAILEELEKEDQLREGKENQSKKKGKKGKKEKKEKKAKASSEELGEEEGKESPKEQKKREKKEKKEQKKQEKADRAAQEQSTKPKKKLSKKKITQVVFLAATFLIIIFLTQKIVMGRIEIEEARDAFFHGDYQHAYALFVGDELSEADQVLFQKAEVVARLEHICEAYENNKIAGNKLKGLDVLMQGILFYNKLMEEGKSELLLQPAMEQYHKIVGYLESDYGVSEEEAYRIVCEEDDYIYSLKLEAIAEGKPYVPPVDSNVNESGQQALDENSLEVSPADIQIDLEDALPEEEGYGN